MTIRINDSHSIKLIAESAKINLECKIQCIAHYNSKDQLTGGVIITDDNGYSCELHSANFINEGGRRELFWAIFNYIFKVRKIKRVFGRIPEWNIEALKLDEHLGFKREAIIPDVYPNKEGLIIMSLIEEDCKFVNSKPPKVTFAPIEETSIVNISQYSFNFGSN